MNRKKTICVGGLCILIAGIVVVIVGIVTKNNSKGFLEIVNEVGSITEVVRTEGDSRTSITDGEAIKELFNLIDENVKESYKSDDDLIAPPPGGREIIFSDNKMKCTYYLIYDPQYLSCDLALRVVDASNSKPEVFCFNLKRSLKAQIDELIDRYRSR